MARYEISLIYIVVDLIGSSPKRRWDMVIPPDFLESYWKYACTFLSVWSPMIFTLFLLAPTVPSAPSPQNLHALVPSGDTSGYSDGAGTVRYIVVYGNGEFLF